MGGSSYWDIGFRGDTGPGSHAVVGGVTGKLSPVYSLLTNASESGSSTNLIGDPGLVNQYCNGSRVPPEFQAGSWNVPPGISDATVPNPLFNLTPAATVDEGNNWINMTWGPLSLVNPVTNATLGNYALSHGSPAIDYVSNASPTFALAPHTDFFGNPRPDPANPNRLDIGAIEYQGSAPTPGLTSISPNSGVRGAHVVVTLTGTDLGTATAVSVSGSGVTGSGVTVVNATTVTATLTITNTAAYGARTVTVTTALGTSNGVTFTVSGPYITSISPNSVLRGTSVPITITGAGLTGATAVTTSVPASITVTNIVVVNDTTITGTMNIANTATTGTRNLTVTTPLGTTTAVTFTVYAPSVTSISPNSVLRGTNVPITITGIGLTGATAVTTSVPATVTVTNIVVVNDTTVTGTMNVAATASLGGRTLTVTTPAGTTAATPFNVTGATLSFSAPSPALNSGGTNSKSGTITVSNASGTYAGSFRFTTAPAIAKTSGTGNGAFSITGGTCVSGLVINPGSNCTINVSYSGETNTSTANGHVTVTGTGLATASQSSSTFPAN